MLKALEIENIAVIEKTSVEFSPGLNVLTGETGAGKSIVIDSINAILGERTSRDLVRNGADTAVVTALFEDIDAAAAEILEDLGFDTEDDGSLLLSKKISASGKSSCKINGKSATVSMLKQVGASLVNIHGQHDSQELLRPECHYKYIDMLIDDKSVIDNYKRSFKNLIKLRRRLKTLTSDESEKERRLELLDYQIKELEDADIKIGEHEQLVKRRDLINKSEAITTALNRVTAALNGDDEIMGIMSVLSSCCDELSSFEQTKRISEEMNDIVDSLETAKDDIARLQGEIDFDPNELEMIEERLDLLYRFSNKYGPNEAAMLDYLDNAKKERNAIVRADEEMENLSREYDSAFDETVDLAETLSNVRKKNAEQFEKQVMDELRFLDMPKLKFTVDFKKGNLSSNGFDKIEFLISANPGEPPKPLDKIASGGELSRIMLAIKSILSYNDTIGTLIFDEIDTGVSGRASQKIGLKLKSVSENTQVICVTHSAQIASNADEHFLISKEFHDGKTFTKVKTLDFSERKKELARIMGGLEITDALLKSAEEMLNSNYKGSKNGT